MTESGLESEMHGDSGRPKGRSRNVILSSNREGATESPSKSDSADLVMEIRDALKTMATTFVQVAQQTETPSQDRSHQCNNSDNDRAGDSTKEEETNREDSAPGAGSEDPTTDGAATEESLPGPIGIMW